ncbi:MAG: hydroxyacid dehydrogenase, partial [Deltaproteobacteria bacterium]|nr:hydroxyacid dehydrogenase [Deltaproteobacteria bacterium]
MARKPEARASSQAEEVVQHTVSSLAGQGEFLLYQTEDAQTRVQVRFQDGGIWLTQAQLAELYQCSSQNITQHIRAIYQTGELQEAA